MKPLHQRQAALVCAGVTLLIGLGWAWAQNPWHKERITAQPFAQVPTYPLEAGGAIQQSLSFDAPNLAAIEFTAALANPGLRQPITITLTLAPADAPDEAPIVAVRRLSGVRPNEPLRFELPSSPQEGTLYLATLRVEGAPERPLALWASRGEAYAGGALLKGAQEEGDLAFTLYFRYTLRQAVEDALQRIFRTLPQIIALLLLLLGPGVALLALLLRTEEMDIALGLGLALGAGLAFWPLLFLWGTALGAHLRPWAVWAVVGLSIGGVALWGLRQSRHGIAVRLHWAREDLVLFAVLAMGLVLRFVQARHLIVPNWVDGLHHTVIAQIMADVGQVPTGGAPFVEMIRFHYHFGFHAVAAALAMAAHLEPYQAVLLYGQVLNALAALAAYTLSRAITPRRWAGVIAAAVVACLGYMPAYYTSWGRYTQLAGLVLLAPLWALSERLYERPWRSKGYEHLLGLTAFLIAGMGLTHYRVLTFYVAYTLCRLGAALVSRQGRKQAFSTAAILVLASLGLVAPWVGRFIPVVREVVPDVYGGWRMPVEDPLPKSLLTFRNTPILLGASALGALWGAVRRQKAVLILTAWCGLVFLSANPQLIGLPKAWLLTNTPVVISFWLPCAALCGYFMADVSALAVPWLGKRLPCIAWQAWLSAGAGVVLLALSAWGAWGMVDIINPQTILVTPEDMEAMRWARQEIPPGAKFLINTTRWMNEVRRGSDGGWWLPLLAGHEVTLPCILYTQGPPAYRETIIALAASVEDASDLRDPAFPALLRKAGVTHLFIGALGGRLTFAELDGLPWLERLYAHGPVRIYVIRPEGTP